MSKEIQQDENPNGGRFFIVRDGKELGEITYSLDGGEVLTIKSTDVDPSLQGEGMGTKLVEKVVNYARRTNKKIISQCPFANNVIEKNENLQDVMKI